MLEATEKPVRTGWSEIENETCRRMAAEGCSAKQIALALENRSRSSVIGHCYRHKINLHGNSRAGQPKASKPRAEAPTTPDPCLAFDGNGQKSILEATVDDCRWIAGDPTAMMICANPVYRRSYCKGHFRLAYR